MRSMILRRLTVAILALTLWPALAAAGNYNVVVQPVYTPDRAQEVYQPLLDYLERETGHSFNLITARTFHHYWADMGRSEDWDLVFDDAHFTDYRIQKFGYAPISRLEDPASYSVVIGSSINADTIKDLVARRIVTMPAPSLGFVVMAGWFTNPLQQPILVSSAVSWEDTVEIVFAGEAEAAVVPRWLADRYPNLYPVAESEAFPGSTLSASENVPPDVQQSITEALRKLHEDEDSYNVLSELNATRFIDAAAEDYAGYGELLETFFGY